MSMPNLDIVRHRWVMAITRYNFDIKYLKGSDNKVADALSQVGQCLDEETVKELLSHATHAGIPWAEVDDP